jgi:hypothetical protein
MAALTTCWLALWERWIMIIAGLVDEPSIHPVSMLVVMVVGVFTTRWAVAATQNNIQLQRPQRIVAASGLASVIVVLWITFGARFPFDYFFNLTDWSRIVSAEALALGVAALIWWRAIRIGRDDDLHATAQREFSGGILALSALFVINKLNPQITTPEAFWPILSFFAIGLGSLALAGFEQDRRIQKSTTGTQLGVSRHWLGTVGAIIGFILVGAVMVAAIASPDTMTALDVVLDTTGVLLITLIGFTVYGLSILLLPIAEAIARAIAPLLKLLLGLSLALPKLGFSVPTPEEINAAARELARTPPFRLIEVAVLLALLAVFFIIAVRRLRLFGLNDSADETRESIFSRDLLWQQLKTLLARRAVASPIATPPFLALDPFSNDPRLIVRRAYQDLLVWAQARQQSRNPQQTPAHYARSLGHTWPTARPALETLTDAYLRARYGQHISAEEARQAERAVQQIIQIADPDNH